MLYGTLQPLPVARTATARLLYKVLQNIAYCIAGLRLPITEGALGRTHGVGRTIIPLKPQ